MKKLVLTGILLLISGFARSEQCYFDGSGEATELAKELRSQNILPATDADILNYMLVSLSNDRIGVPADQMRHAKVYVRTSLEEIKNRKLEKKLKKAALTQIEKAYDSGRYAQSSAQEMWTEFYAPRISGIIKGRRNLLSKVSEVLDRAEISDCVLDR